MTDTTLSVNTTYANGKGISSGDRLILAPDRNITVTFPVDYTHTGGVANNLVVEGQLVSQPDATHTHIFEWTGIDTTQYVGGVSSGALSTDPGTWVLNAGNLLVNGTPRVGWNRIGTDPSWRAGDEVRSVPWLGTGMTVDLDTTATFVPGVDTPGFYDIYGDPDLRQYQEICNLTRNVIFRGQVNAESHININMATVPQVFNNVALQFMGPKDNRTVMPGATPAEREAYRLAHNRDKSFLIKGRWALHYHMMEDGSRGSNPSGVIIRDGRSRAFVTHASMGVTYYDCISWRQGSGGFWFDNTENESPNEAIVDAPGDLTYNHCGVVVTGGYLIGSVRFNNRNHIFDTFAAGMPQNDQSGSGAPGVHDWINKAFVGSGALDQPGDIWDWHDNVVHNVGGLGIRAWQNEDNQHVIDRATVFKVKWKNNQRPDGHAVGALSGGAYRTDYDFVDCIFEGGVWDAAASHANGTDLTQHGIRAMPGRNYVRCRFDNKDLGQHVQPSELPTKYIDCTFYPPGVSASDPKPTQIETKRSYDFIRTNIGPLALDPTGTMLNINGGLTPDSIYRFQDVNGNAWVLSHGVGSGRRTPVSMAANSNIVVGTVGMFSPTDVGLAITVEQAGPYEPEGTGSEQRLPLTGTVTSYTDSSHITISVYTPTTVFNPGEMPAPVPGSVSGVDIFFLAPFVKPYTFTPLAQSFALYISTSSLTTAALGDPYTQQLAAVPGESATKWGQGAMSWSVAPESDPLPTGISLSSSGVLSGTPTQTGTFPVTFRVMDSNNLPADRALTLTVGASASLQITTANLPGAVLGEAYSQQLAATGGVPF